MKLKQMNIPAEVLIPLIEEQITAGKSVKFSPKGKSMLPLLREGKDTVTLSSINGDVKKYDILLYRRKDGQYVLHRLVEIGESLVFCGDNQYVLEYGITREMLIAKVSCISRAGKSFALESFFYRLYSVSLCKTRKLRYFIVRVKRKLFRILKRN